jgi:gamma-glutamylcyclotransferase (GGCT)/AIG2-like uncharacterized protein YtfP
MLYFAYGMNTNSKKMSKSSKRLGPATLLYYTIEMLQYANIIEDKNGHINGILWDIDEKELARLDKREGYPTCYNRILGIVKHNGENKIAWIYYMTNEYREKAKKKSPTKEYIDMITEGFNEK